MYLCGMRYLNVSLENNIKRFGDACIKPEGGWGTLDGVWGFSNPPPSDPIPYEEQTTWVEVPIKCIHEEELMGLITKFLVEKGYE